MEELFQATTFDEAKMEDLLRQVAEAAPALEQVRCNAIDAGFYWFDFTGAFVGEACLHRAGGMGCFRVLSVQGKQAGEHSIEGSEKNRRFHGRWGFAECLSVN